MKTASKGFDRGHEMIEDLRRKDFIGVAELSPDAVTAPDFLDHFAGLCRDAAPWMRYLCGALEVAF